MTNWPEDYSGAWTLAGQAERSGVGLHSGRSSVVRLKGSDEPGFYLRVEGHDEAFRLAPHQVRDSQLCTTLDWVHARWPLWNICWQPWLGAA